LGVLIETRRNRWVSQSLSYIARPPRRGGSSDGSLDSRFPVAKWHFLLLRSNAMSIHSMTDDEFRDFDNDCCEVDELGMTDEEREEWYAEAAEALDAAADEDNYDPIDEYPEGYPDDSIPDNAFTN